MIILKSLRENNLVETKIRSGISARIGRFFLLENKEIIFLFSLGLAVAYFVLGRSFSPLKNQHYILLANSMLQGRLDVNISSTTTSLSDLAHFAGKYYLVWSFFPALFYLPFVFLCGLSFRQEYLLLFFDLWIFYLIFKFIRRIGFRKIDSFWLTFTYLLGSSFCGVFIFSASTFLYHLIGNIFIFLSLNEFFGKRTWLKIGVFLGLAVLTRTTFLLNASFFLTYLAWEKKIPLKEKLKNILYFSAPIAVGLTLSGFYNFLRFGSFFETGYNYLKVASPNLLFSFSHLLENLYFSLLRPPQIIWENILSLNPPFLKAPLSGFGFLFTSFSFLLIFKRGKFQQKELLKFLIIPLILGVFFSLTWFSSGGAQFGYRFFLDYQPFLYVILLLKLHPQINRWEKLMITASALLNLSLVFTLIY